MPDESPPRGAASKVVPSHLLDPAPLREPSEEELERYRWQQMARFGRHGWAARGTGLLGFVGVILLSLASVLPAHWVVATRGDGFAWLLVLGVPVLAGVYRVLLAQWDQEAARFGGGRVSLDAWRAGEVRDASHTGDAREPRP